MYSYRFGKSCNLPWAKATGHWEFTSGTSFTLVLLAPCFHPQAKAVGFWGVMHPDTSFTFVPSFTFIPLLPLSPDLYHLYLVLSMTHHDLITPPGCDTLYIIPKAGKKDQPVVHLFELTTDVQLICQIWRYAVVQGLPILVYDQDIVDISAGILHPQHRRDTPCNTETGTGTVGFPASWLHHPKGTLGIQNLASQFLPAQVSKFGHIGGIMPQPSLE